MKYLIRNCNLLLFAFASIFSMAQQSSDEFKIDVERYQLKNGLTILLHEDHSDPIVAVALTAHVGSAREKEGRTGFAHLFEHLLFLESENLGKGGLDAMSARIGGSGANGSTNRDRTNYFQTVPSDALEKMIWAEADKLGYFINTVTEPVLAKEKQVVKNEKRQGVDNRPYGHEGYVVGKNLYPENHPYNWQVIGSLEDLQNATVEDVKEFYKKWYTPNNTVLTIAGDFDKTQAKEWIKKYFSEIPSGAPVDVIAKQPVQLTQSKKLYYEDNFAALPQLTMTWPGTPVYSKDSYALGILSSYLSSGKAAPLNKVLVDSLKLSNRVSMSDQNSELAGEIELSVRAYDGIQLNKVQDAIYIGLANFEKEGISAADLDRIKAQQETSFYRSLSSVLGKGFQLAQYEIFAGDASYINKDLKMIQQVTAGDVMAVYNKYIKNKNYIATSFVPKGAANLALADSKPAEVVEEKIENNPGSEVDPNVVANYERTYSSFDRTVEPEYGSKLELVIPEIWKNETNSGIKIFGISNDEVPLVTINMDIKGGMLLENPATIGVSNLLSKMMLKGTKTKTTEQLEQALDDLGASIYISSGDQDISLNATVLKRNYDELMKLITEIITEPRWDITEFDLLKQSTSSQLTQQKSDPNSIASNEFSKLIYGKNHILAQNNIGTQESIEKIGIEDLKSYYNNYISPNVTSYRVVGAVSKSEVTKALQPLIIKWKSKEVSIPEIAEISEVKESKVYFYDVPGAKQSVLSFGYPALSYTDADFYPAQVMNYRLGGGSFASQLTQQLREGKGYTYGIRSGFSGSKFKGPFSITSGVRSNVTFESSKLIKEILENYGNDFNSKDLEVSKSFLIKSKALSFETAQAKLGMLTIIDKYNQPEDYARRQLKTVEEMTVARIKELAQQYLTPDKMIYLIVGDAATQLEKMKELGYGEPIKLN
ncbi:M16 family metallopeptidase [Nonlabens antarcticus]|uniref:M16 family metallopeptidase n=1 Tax=Nonlabens antarcticus TaxID=392714 RepID=UPI001890EE38|nr:pitrilysin family protein [Nonlabens antarcticus]